MFTIGTNTILNLPEQVELNKNNIYELATTAKINVYCHTVTITAASLNSVIGYVVLYLPTADDLNTIDSLSNAINQLTGYNDAIYPMHPYGSFNRDNDNIYPIGLMSDGDTLYIYGDVSNEAGTNTTKNVEVTSADISIDDAVGTLKFSIVV